MTDYTVATGATGSLIIRDDGSTVSAIINNPSTQTYSNGVSWSIYLGNGGSTSGTVNVARGSAVTVWSGVISTSMSVQFNMGSTGTQGLGGPTTNNANIFRATVPSAPGGLDWSGIGIRAAQLNFSGSSSNGGAGIDYYLARYGKSNPPEAGSYVEFTTGTGANPRTGLDDGGRYYDRVYAHNGVGYSAPSAVYTVLILPGAPTLGPWTNPATNSAQLNFSGLGGQEIDSYRIHYGKSNPPESGTYTALDTVNGNNVISGLDPGTTYYATVFSHNASGFSVASAVQSVLTLPSSPVSKPWSAISIHTATINFTGNGNQGIDTYLIRYGKANPPDGGGAAYVEVQTLNGSVPISGLDPGTAYYFVVYAHNASGYSIVSATQGMTTLAGAHIRVAGVWKNAVPYVRVNGIWRVATPYIKVGGVWKIAD